MEKERLHYIDVAKGILILMVVYGHIYGCVRATNMESTIIEYIHHSVNLFVSFYMPCFFVITGYCSAFKKSFCETLFQSFKTIVLPAVVFSALSMKSLDYESLVGLARMVILYGGAYWFLSTLFLTKVFYWVVVNKIESKNIQNVLILLIFAIGFNVNVFYQGIQPWYFVHMLLLLPFLHMGQMLKKYGIKNMWFAVAIYCGSFLITSVLSHEGILRIDYFYHVPGISLKLLNMNYSMLISFILLSVSGCLFFLNVCKRIGSNRILEYLGKNSLVIYCLHWFVLKRIIFWIGTIGVFPFLFKLFLAYFLTILICCFVAYILNLKYLRIFLGKF